MQNITATGSYPTRSVYGYTKNLSSDPPLALLSSDSFCYASGFVEWRSGNNTWDEIRPMAYDNLFCIM